MYAYFESPCASFSLGDLGVLFGMLGVEVRIFRSFEVKYYVLLAWNSHITLTRRLLTNLLFLYGLMIMKIVLRR
jgi:hypothetical protein